MTIHLNVPEDIASRLETQGQDLSRLALQSLALEAYRAELLTTAEVARLLGYDTPYALDGFLKEHGVYLDYTPEELEREAADSQRLLRLRQRELNVDDSQRHAG